MFKQFLIGAMVFVLFALAALLASTARAMPEYAVRTGEPCGACHVSAAGGGLRSVRGQAWVSAGRPAQVPSTDAALAQLGIHLATDPSAYTNTTPAADAAPLPVKPGALEPLFERLQDYDGN